MKSQKKKYSTPTAPFDKERLEREKVLLKEFGLRKKRDLWRAEALLRKYRRLAREVAAKENKERGKLLVEKLIKMGLLSPDAALDDLLSLSVRNFLERRLSTIVFKKGLANSLDQARQFVTHGHVLVNGRKVYYPSYLVSKNEEAAIKVVVLNQKRKDIINGSAPAVQAPDGVQNG